MMVGKFINRNTMAKFNVIWDIEDIEAENPLEAAKKVQEWLRRDEWQFYVQNVETKEISSVDLQEEDNVAVLPVKNFKSIIL